ncbi:hypothetical protein SAMN04487891_10450 [Flagellimonas taeanensis]|uniref:Adenylate and Guanylate cyclase catalytic domain-containing protein n=1 Tax=Flagellimonas taeanensis TaxID=1005926 RepID=A0A1M6XEX2_9FLAO|nr:adenylate/guanylate cyclase domain-containing protein [Allomuricauda taeanensis]SFB95338.1 hypothetical protein SAMN04487891_10450 [Allomuricauda taeanensis]SHL04517.1 hypothetical protein SAMN05216293_2552 [Allomuricauda taeanensis]
MNIFDNYKNVIRKAVENDPIKSKQTFSLNESLLDRNREFLSSLKNELPGRELSEDMKTLARGMGVAVTFDYQPLGSHPDFIHLKGTDMVEEHWIISGFIDVKKSTRLFNRFTKGTVRLITESIIRASILAVNLCGGYVHRVQGDGLMVYFGGKSIDKKKAVEDALKSFSMISYFVKNDLKDFFEENGVQDIHTRAGLDLGHTNQVDWFYSGVGDSGEVTTCSLHTSLAPKMQANADDNGMVVGHNIATNLGRPKYFEQKTKEIHDYEDGRLYHQYNFDWERYLVDIGLAVQNHAGVLVLTLNAFPDPKRDSRDLYPIASKSKPYFSRCTQGN